MEANPAVLQTQRLPKKFMNAMKRIHIKVTKQVSNSYKTDIFDKKKQVFKVVKQALKAYRQQRIQTAKEANASKKAERDAAKEANASKKAERDAAKEAKVTKKAERDAEKEANASKKAERDAAKEAKATKKAERDAAKEAKSTKKAERDAEKEAKATKKAERDAAKESKATKKAERDAEKEAKATKKAERDAEKEAKATKKAERDAEKEAKATKKAERDAAKEVNKSEEYINLKITGQSKDVDEEEVRKHIDNYFTELKKAKGDWSNGLLCMEHGVWLEDENRQFEWQDNSEVYSVHLMTKGYIVYFKIIPKCILSNNTHPFDGEVKVTNKPGRKKVVKENTESVSMIDQIRQDYKRHVVPEQLATV